LSASPSGTDRGTDRPSDVAEAAAPHGPEVLERFPQVGIFQARKNEPGPSAGFVANLLERLPFLRRHPHLMVVHFPLAFSITPILFFALFILSGRKAFATTTLHCLGAAKIS
jgi:hypothetical protein